LFLLTIASLALGWQERKQSKERKEKKGMTGWQAGSESVSKKTLNHLLANKLLAKNKSLPHGLERSPRWSEVASIRPNMPTRRPQAEQHRVAQSSIQQPKADQSSPEQFRADQSSPKHDYKRHGAPNVTHDRFTFVDL
jgi:hypothetical protein